MSNFQDAPVGEGEIIAGKYRVERVLGEGGMGVVVAARHLQLEQLVAIKFLLPTAMQNQQIVERFLQEARASVMLKSEHVAKVLDVGTLSTGAPYMVMEYLEGEDLSTILNTQGPLDVETACNYLVQGCEAIAEAHSRGIVHRDLKPANFFLSRSVGGSRTIKVLDFGVSKLTGDGGIVSSKNLTQTREMMGSPVYMSPEQMRSSRTVTQSTDIWALGVVLFELLTRQYPFDAESMPDLCVKVVSDPPVSLRSLRPDVPEEIEAIVGRCLQKDPEQRFANVAELASALEVFAPVESHVAAENARVTLGDFTKTKLSESGAGATALSRPRTPVGSRSVPGLTTPQPSTASAGAPRSWLLLVAAVLLVLLVGGGFALGRSGADKSSSKLPASATASQPPSASVVPALPTASSAPVVTSAPPLDSSAPALSLSPVHSGAPVTVGHSGASSKGKSGAGGGKSKSSDGDIPSIR